MQRHALRIYRLASLVAFGEGAILFSLGLDLHLRQVLLLILFGWPAPLMMYACDAWLIRRQVQPIDTVQTLLRDGQAIPPDAVRDAYFHTLNLPILTLLRVLMVHAPAVLMPFTALTLVANHIMDLGLAGWQFAVLWSLWPITAAPHALMEYFLIERQTRRLLSRLELQLAEVMVTLPPQATMSMVLRLLLGKCRAAPPLIRTTTGTQLAWVFFFVSLIPMCVLGGSVYVKMAAGAAPGYLGVWIACLIVFNASVSVAIVLLMSRQVRSAMAELLNKMQQILQGDLSAPWRPRTTDEFLELGVGFNAMLLGLRDREVIKETFGRFVSPDVATAVLERQVPLQGELREVTILFQDIRGFTSLSEKLHPEALVHLVNAFLTEMVAAVESQGGTIRQFTGDGVMAMFGAPVLYPDAPIRAVRAALAMLVRLDGLNQRRAAQGEAPLRIGVGVHTGEVVVGCIGPDTRMEYSVVGDAVNLASRVESLTKEVGATILVTDATAAQLGGSFVLGKRTVLPVRGKAQPIGVIEVLGER